MVCPGILPNGANLAIRAISILSPLLFTVYVHGLSNRLCLSVAINYLIGTNLHKVGIS